MRKAALTVVAAVLIAIAVWLVHALVRGRQALTASAAMAATAGRPSVVRPGSTGGYLVSPGIYAGPAPTGPLPPPPGPGLMPTGFQSRTFYSMPPVDPATNATLDVSGDGPNGSVGNRGLRVVRVAAGSRLDTVYGLCAGDLITQLRGSNLDATDPVPVAKAYVLETVGSGNLLTVRRGDRTLHLQPDRPPQDITPGATRPAGTGWMPPHPRRREPATR